MTTRFEDRRRASVPPPLSFFSSLLRNSYFYQSPLARAVFKIDRKWNNELIIRISPTEHELFKKEFIFKRKNKNK